MNGLYFIGEPGVGKSALVAALTAGTDPEWRYTPFAHAVYLSDDGRPQAAQIGGSDPHYPGTDRLSMSVLPRAIDWLSQAPTPFVFGEGDRLANGRFFQAMTEWCDEWRLVVLNAPSDVAADRRARRGSQQNPGWVKGRRTKFLKLAHDWHDHAVTLDATAPTAQLAREIRALGYFDWALT